LSQALLDVITTSQILPRLSIRSKLVIAFVGLSALPLVFVGLYGLYANMKTTERLALEGLTHDVHSIRERTGNFLASVESDLLVLRNSFRFERYVRSVGNGSPRSRKELLSQMEEELIAFAATKRIYYQIRIADEERDEVLCVQCNVTPDSALFWHARSAEDLHEGGESYYFLLTMNLPPGKIAFSPAELTYDGEKRIPVISFAMPLYRSSERVGILIANVFARDLFQEMQTARTLGIDEKVVLVAGDGHYLYNSNERNQWNKLIASREEDNLQKDYPTTIARMIVSGDEGAVREGTDDIIAHAPLFPTRAGAQAGQLSSGFAESLFVFESVPRATMTRDARIFALTFLAFLVLFLGGAVVLGLLATRQFTKPISELQRGASIISSGDYGGRLHVNTGDEIEELAKQFNVMAASLEAREQEIQQHRTHLEQMVDNRTRELLSQKEELQAILDNVASAFVLLDRNFRIQTASAAFASITGLRQEEVLGQDSRVVLADNGLCKTPPSSVIIPQERIDSHVDRSIDRSGVERYFEHITVPIKNNGEVIFLLQIITDITKRRQLEQHLVQSEKLMATGEMSAIIAHGFRNSLTSIKMILQLQHEMKHVGSANRKSLGVALDSIHRMETMVQELLTFARPTPMKFRDESVNGLVDDALALVQATVTKQGIDVKKKLDAKLPLVLIDAPHFKEALVNILLNSIQAMESRGSEARNDSLIVSTKRVILSKTLRDFHPSAITQNDGEGRPARGSEITLAKGSKCVVVSFTDSGPGIDRTLLSRIFDPFFTTKTNGTGLGLPMVKRTVNAHGGIVVVKNTRGRGVTFEIVLPCRRRE
jgi:PAS domain S-box-containing protein